MDDIQQPAGGGTTLIQFPSSGGNAVPVQAEDGVGGQQSSPQNAFSVQNQHQNNNSTPGYSKEMEPITMSKVNNEQLPPLDIEPEVEKAGVSEVTTDPVIQDKYTKEELTTQKTQPIIQEKEEKEPLPMPRQQARKLTKGLLLFKNVSNALFWYAMLILRQWQIKDIKKRNDV